MLVVWLGLSAWAEPAEPVSEAVSAASEADVARGWYLWRTGQDEAALAQAKATVEQHPEDYAAHELAIAMEITSGEGASTEARYREAWGEDSQEHRHRVRLAFVLTLRNPEAGNWCDEVDALIAPVLDGEGHYWATRAERQAELRCKGTTDHADAEFRRISREGGIGWADGVIAKMRARYLKTELADDLERLWTEYPHRLDESWVLWDEGVSGPARMRSRRITLAALNDATNGDDPVLIHAAAQAFRNANKPKRFEDALERLTSVDPKADPLLARSLDDVADPAIYRELDSCEQELGPMRVIKCLEGKEAGETGAIAAYRFSKIRDGYRSLKMAEPALQAANAAYLADPTHRFNARQLGRAVLAMETVPEIQLSNAIEAIDSVMDGRFPVDPETVAPDDKRRRLAADLDLRSRLYLRAERAEDAVAGQRLALALVPTPTRQILLGLVLAAADRPYDAGLQLVAGVAAEGTDTASIAEARQQLVELNQVPWERSSTWHPGGMAGMMREVASGPDDPRPTHPLVGRRLPKLDALAPIPEPTSTEPATPETEASEPTASEEPTEPPPPLRARVIVTWAPFSEASVQGLERLQGLEERYAEKGVTFQVVDVGIEASELPEDRTLDNTFGGAEVMRALRAVVPPTAVIVTPRDRVMAVLAPWHWTRVELEKELDDLL